MTRHETIQEMQEHLDALLERRKTLVNMWLVFVVFLIGSFALPRMAVRFFGTYAWFIVLIVAAAVLGYVGLRLLAQTIDNVRQARVLRASIKAKEAEQRHKRKRAAAGKRWWWRSKHSQDADVSDDDEEEHAYTIGADGELVEEEVPQSQSENKHDR